MVIKGNKVRAKLASIKEAEHLAKVRGPKGQDGKDGNSGKDGREIELGRSDTHIQWRYVGESEWRDLVDLDELKGDKPRPGIDYFVMHGKDGRDGRNGQPGIAGESGGDSLLEDSTFTYTDGLVTRIDYESGQYKELSYNVDDTVHTVVWHRDTDIVTKTFTYNGDGTVASIDVEIT